MALIKLKLVKIGTDFFPAGCTKQIECSELTPTGHFWYTPSSSTNGVFNGYKKTAGTATKPNIALSDSFKVVEARWNNTNISIVVADAETDKTLSDNCNVCCGDTPTDMSGNTIPAFALEATICPNAAGNRIISEAYPSGTIKVAASFNGAPASPAPSSSYASAAAFVTWANSNWSAYATWANDSVNGIINATLANGVTTGGVNIYT